MSLWKHQVEGSDFIVPIRRGGLFMEMRTGKTRTSLECLRRWQVNTALIVCPKSVVPVWEAEINQAFPGRWRVVSLIGQDSKQFSIKDRAKEVVKVVKKQEPAIFVINYEAVWREPLRSVWFNINPEAVILDESHRIKSPGGRASWFFYKLGPKVPHRLLLTGTPCPHSPLDIYAQFRFLAPEIFGRSFVLFRGRYAIMGGFNGHQVVSYQNLEELHRKMYSISYRVRAADCFDLPEEQDQVIPYIMNEKTRKLYEELKEEFIVFLEQTGLPVTAPNALVKLTRLQQITSGFVVDERQNLVLLDEDKLSVLRDLLEDVGEEPVVIFCRFVKDIQNIRALCDKMEIKSCEMSGAAHEVDKFNRREAQVIVCQIQSGSLGINLSRASICIFYSHTFNMGDYEQARKRVHGHDQQAEKVIYYHLAAHRSVDQYIMAALKKRSKVVNYVVDELRKEKVECEVTT